MTEPDDNLDSERDDSCDVLGAEVELEFSEDVGVEDEDEAEFTLATLSEAYAEVVQATDEGEVSVEAESEGGEDDPKAAGGHAEDSSVSNEQDLVDDVVVCPVSPDSIVESILFVGCPSDVKLTGKKIASVLRDVSPKEVGQIVKKLNARYRQQNAAYRIDAQKGVYRMVLDESLAEFQNDYFGRNREAKLNQSAIDILAVVAYHQPATRDQIEAVRGKSCGGVLNQLLKRELLSLEKTNDKPAQKVYRTTDRFLDLFHLETIEDLPQSHEVADIEELAD